MWGVGGCAGYSQQDEATQFLGVELLDEEKGKMVEHDEYEERNYFPIPDAALSPEPSHCYSWIPHL